MHKSSSILSWNNFPNECQTFILIEKAKEKMNGAASFRKSFNIIKPFISHQFPVANSCKRITLQIYNSKGMWMGWSNTFPGTRMPSVSLNSSLYFKRINFSWHSVSVNHGVNCVFVNLCMNSGVDFLYCITQACRQLIRSANRIIYLMSLEEKITLE